MGTALKIGVLLAQALEGLGALFQAGAVDGVGAQQLLGSSSSPSSTGCALLVQLGPLLVEGGQLLGNAAGQEEAENVLGVAALARVAWRRCRLRRAS